MPGSAEIIPVNIEDEMKDSYLDYAMSVIIGRAIPDVRDGLKPVHRRILYAMLREGLLSNKRYSKCAGVVGEVLKKYHPHGDLAVYDALVRMAQDWNMRYPLIDGQGNFGCFTGDTRVRLADGTSRSFIELVADDQRGITHFTYTIQEDGKIAMAPIHAPRLTKRNVPVISVTLNHGKKITCTPDHRFLLRDGNYREAQFLSPGDSLMPFYSRFYEGEDLFLKGYEEVYNPADNTWIFAHHLADDYNLNTDLSSNGRRTTQSRFLTICKWALERFGSLAPDHYESVRHSVKAKGIIHFERGVSEYFKGDLQLLEQACRTHNARLNHTVVFVQPAGRADVYDLTVDSTHNFSLADGVFVHNSVDGDPPAAYRYTEARLTKLAEELLSDIDKETVDFIPNFDESTLEPVVLPTRVPNLLVNGSDGIAVGMATKIPPHNLKEVCDGIIALIRNPDLPLPELMKIIPGPDFPTGGFIYGREGIREAHQGGKGIIQMRARAVIEPMAKGDRENIIVTEIPYQVNKARLIEKIAELIRDGKIEGISDLRDESDKDGMRIVVELKKGTVAGVVLNQLYKHTAMQSTFGVIMLAIVGGQPRILNLKDFLRLFIEHRKEVVIRRTAYELRKAQERAHILEGLKIALDHLDAVIALIRKSKTPQEAKEGLMGNYQMTEIQAQAILDMRLQRLTAMERDKILEEYEELKKLIAQYEQLLKSEKMIYDLIIEETAEIQNKFGDSRRTEIQSQTKELSVEDLIAEEEMVVTTSHGGFIKRNPISLYRAQRRGGHGKSGMTTGDEDFVSDLFIASTHSYVLIFTSHGKVHWVKVYDIPQAGRTAKGKSIANLIQLSSDERVAAVLPVREFEEGKYIIFATRNGVVKKTELTAYSNPRVGGIIALGVETGDELIEVALTDGKQDILLSSREGQSIRFSEEEVRPMGRNAVGVIGIRLEMKDQIVSMEVLRPKATILSVTENGFGKRTEVEEYRVQGRGGSGIITIKTTDRNGSVVGVKQVTDDDDVMLITNRGKIIRMKIKGISVMGRNTQGVRLIHLETDEKVVAFAKLAEKEEEEQPIRNGEG